MTTLLVDLAVLATIGAIVWYFFLSRQPDEAVAQMRGEHQELVVRVKGGYIPEVARGRAGVPLRLSFKREETSPCSDEVVFPTLGVRRPLPAFETTPVDLPALETGTYPFTCGMDMMHGWLVVGDAPAEMPAPVPAADEWPIDPVCGMKVDPARATATLVRDGRTFYFCCVGCKERFEQGGPKPPVSVPLEIRRRS
jgi:Cu+-exporting ATPase